MSLWGGGSGIIRGLLLGAIRHLNKQQYGEENAMSTAISWVFEAAIKPDELDEYRALAQEISADNEAAEPAQVIFEWFIDDHDVHIYERYTDWVRLF